MNMLLIMLPYFWVLTEYVTVLYAIPDIRKIDDKDLVMKTREHS